MRPEEAPVQALEAWSRAVAKSRGGAAGGIAAMVVGITVPGAGGAVWGGGGVNTVPGTAAVLNCHERIGNRISLHRTGKDSNFR
jgi:hypothetical protein